MWLLFPHTGINRDLNQTGHTELHAWSGSAQKYAPFTTGCGGMAWKLTYVLIQACTGLDGDDLEWYDRWIFQPGWDRELARHVEKPSEAGSGHPLRTCTAEMKGCLVLEQQHQTTASSCILSPIPHSPSISVSLSWLSPQYDIVLHVFARLPGCHGYPMLKVSQQDNPRRHSQITWIQFASHLCLFRCNLIYLFPCRAIQHEYK